MCHISVLPATRAPGEGVVRVDLDRKALRGEDEFHQKAEIGLKPNFADFVFAEFGNHGARSWLPQIFSRNSWGEPDYGPLSAH